MLPASKEALKTAGHAYNKEFPPNHKLAMMNSKIERVEMMRRYAPLTPTITKACDTSLEFYCYCCSVFCAVTSSRFVIYFLHRATPKHYPLS